MRKSIGDKFLFFIWIITVNFRSNLTDLFESYLASELPLEKTLFINHVASESHVPEGLQHLPKHTFSTPTPLCEFCFGAPTFLRCADISSKQHDSMVHGGFLLVCQKFL